MQRPLRFVEKALHFGRLLKAENKRSILRPKESASSFKRWYKSEKRVINNQKHRISLPFLLFFALETWRNGVKKTGVCFHKVGTCSNQLPIFFLPPPFSALPKPRFIPQKRPLRFYLLRKSVQKPFIHFKTNGSPSASFVMIYSQLLSPPPSHSPPRRPRSPQNPYSSLKIR